MSKESKLNMNTSDYAISHCNSDKTYNGLEVHKMLCDAYIAGNNNALDDKDEEIRNALINVFATHKDYEVFFGVSTKDIRAWLEKQNHDDKKWIYEDVYLKEKEQLIQDGIDEVLENSQKYGLKKQGEKKETDKVKPKFKVGDWITDGDVHCKISDILDDRYIVDTKFTKRSSIPFKRENNYHLWTIKDAKNSDFLAAEDKNFTTPFVAIYKERGLDFFNSHCFIGFNENFYEGEAGHSIENIHPATKEQRDLLFQKMKEAGYKWDTEKKELKKIEENSFESDRVVKAMRKAGYEWSEETHLLKKIEQKTAE